MFAVFDVSFEFALYQSNICNVKIKQKHTNVPKHKHKQKTQTHTHTHKKSEEVLENICDNCEKISIDLWKQLYMEGDTYAQKLVTKYFENNKYTAEMTTQILNNTNLKPPFEFLDTQAILQCLKTSKCTKHSQCMCYAYFPTLFFVFCVF